MDINATRQRRGTPVTPATRLAGPAATRVKPTLSLLFPLQAIAIRAKSMA